MSADTPHEFFGIAFWLGFTTHLVAAEAWITYTRHGVAVANHSDVAAVRVPAVSYPDATKQSQ
jgi:hypothetical protein